MSFSRQGVLFTRLAFISTTLVLGWHGQNISEERPGRPVWSIGYVRAKRMAEEYLLEQYRRTGLPVVIRLLDPPLHEFVPL
jgi:nucleoside-diphosphate-sugar epimerase